VSGLQMPGKLYEISKFGLDDVIWQVVARVCAVLAPGGPNSNPFAVKDFFFQISNVVGLNS